MQINYQQLKYIISMCRKHGLIIGGKLLTMYLSWLICILIPCIIRSLHCILIHGSTRKSNKYTEGTDFKMSYL